MNQWFRFLLASLTVASIVMAAGMWARAQAPQTQAPTIISGANVGFRIDAQRSRLTGKVTGAWVIRVDGQWVEPVSVPSRRNLVAP
jgi:hypothetical protein